MIDGVECTTEDMSKFIKKQNKIDRIKKINLVEREKLSLKILKDGLRNKHSKTVLAINLGTNTNQIKEMILKNGLKKEAQYLNWF